MIVVLLVLLTGTGVSEATSIDPVGAIESSGIVLVGRLASVQRGRLLSPRERWGKIEVIEILKGRPPSGILDIRLTDSWGQPSFVARLGTVSFWLFVFFLGCLVITAVRFKKLKEKGKANRKIILLSVVTVLALVNMFALGQGFVSGRPQSPSAILGKPMLWTISGYEGGKYRGYFVPLNAIKVRMQCCKESIMKSAGQDTQRILNQLDKYLGRQKTGNP